MRLTIRKLLEGQTSWAGQSMVEFLVMSTILLILFLGIMDVGRAYFTYLALQDVAGEGSNYAAQVPGTALTYTCTYATDANTSLSNTVVSRVKNSAPIGASVDWDATQVCVDTRGGVAQGNFVTITVISPYYFLTPFVGTVVSSQSINLTGYSVAVINKP